MQAYLSEWRFVFWITFCTHITKAVVFGLWGSAEVQLWNNNRKRAPIVARSRIRTPY